MSTEYEAKLLNINENNNVITHLLTTEPAWNNYVQFAPGSTSIVYTYISGNPPATFAPFWALFNDPDNKDFTLAAGSDAIGAADPATATATDALGVPRDAQPDAGAYEFVSGPLPGDADGDGDVDLDDFVALKSNFGMTTGAAWSQGNFDGDDDVDLDDFVILKANFGATAQ